MVLAQINSQTGSWPRAISTFGSAGLYFTISGGTIALITASTERLFIGSTGLIGIGTITPSAAVEISTTQTVALRVFMSGTEKYLLSNGNLALLGSNDKVQFGPAASGNQLGGNENGALVFLTGSATRLTLDASGDATIAKTAGINGASAGIGGCNAAGGYALSGIMALDTSGTIMRLGAGASSIRLQVSAAVNGAVHLEEKASPGATTSYGTFYVASTGRPRFVTSSNTDTEIPPYQEGTFTVTATGFDAANPTGTARYVLHGSAVTIFVPSMTGTSSATTCTLTGVPNAILAGRQTQQPLLVTNNGVPSWGQCQISATSVWTAWPGPAGASSLNWAATGTKTIHEQHLTYTRL